jgi:hypothetical protein
MAELPNFFRGKASDVVRVVLVNYPKRWSLRDLTREAGVALGWASKVSRALIRERLALRDSTRSELKLMMPFDLLKRWAAVNNFATNTTFVEYYSKEEDVSKFLKQFKSKNGPKYALTGLAGALLVAPFVRPTNIHIYVKSEEDVKKWANLLGLMPVEENGNIKFAIAEDEGVFYGAREIDGVRVVSDIQLYVDLLNYPARGEEAAQAVLKVIEKRWKQAKG